MSSWKQRARVWPGYLVNAIVVIATATDNDTARFINERFDILQTPKDLTTRGASLFRIVKPASTQEKCGRMRTCQFQLLYSVVDRNATKKR